MKRFIYAIKITLIKRMHFTQLIFPPHNIFCCFVPYRNVQPFSARNINSPVNTMSSRHHPYWADDWTATYVTAPVLIRYLKALLLSRFTGNNEIFWEDGILIAWEILSRRSNVRREKSQFYLIWVISDRYSLTANNSAVKTWALTNCEGSWKKCLFVTESTKIFTATYVVLLLRFANWVTNK